MPHLLTPNNINLASITGKKAKRKGEGAASRRRQRGRSTYLGSVAIIPEPQGEGRGAVVLVQEDGDEDASRAPPFLGLVSTAFCELDHGAKIKDVGDAEPLEGGHSIVLEPRRFGRAKEHATSDGLARLTRDSIPPYIT